MQVLCINTLSTIKFDGKNIDCPLQFLETYTVVKFERKFWKTFYVLEEMGEGISFIEAAFLPLSDLDETQLINHPINKTK
jgi:hypothetical protein